MLDQYNEEPLEPEDLETVDLTKTKAEEDYQDDEDNDGQKFALAIGAVRDEDLNRRSTRRWLWPRKQHQKCWL